MALANHYHAMLGGQFVPVNSAHEWWNNRYAQVDAIYNRSSTPVAGAVFVSRGGIYDALHGHIGVVTKVHGNGTFDTMEQNAGTWRYVGRYTRGMANMLGFLIPKNNPAVQPLEPTQRRVGANPVKRRADATTKSAEKQPPLDPHAVGNFVGWKNGERVNDGIANTDVWFKGTSGDWFWSGGFTSQSTAGLANLNAPAPPSVAANQRQVDPVPVNVRKTASASAEKIGEIAANAIVTPLGWVTGQSVQGISIWYKIDGGFAWAGGFTKEDTGGLIDLNPKEPAPTPTPTPPPLPTDPTGPTQDIGTPGPVLATIDRWSESAPEFGKVFPRHEPATAMIEFPGIITERTQAPIGGFYVGREGVPNHFVLHHGAQPSLDGLLRTLNGPGVPTANYAIKDRVVVSMVDIRDTPSTNTRWRSNQYSITLEIANDLTTTDKPSMESHESAAWVLARDAMRYGFLLPLKVGVNVFGHKDVSKTATACPGLLDMQWITNRANEIIVAEQNQEPAPEPAPEPTPQPGLDDIARAINRIGDTLEKVYRVN